MSVCLCACLIKKDRVRLILRPNSYLTAKKFNLISNDNALNIKTHFRKTFHKIVRDMRPSFRRQEDCYPLGYGAI
jgi:hypothetical protein